MTRPKLLDRVRAEIRNRCFSYRTGQAYVLWFGKSICFDELGHHLAARRKRDLGLAQSSGGGP